MPAWVYSLGKVLSKEAQINIPILGLLGNLLITVGPCLIGLLMSYLFPKIKKAALKIAKPFTLLVMLSFLIISFMAKFYLFKLVRLRHWYSSKFYTLMIYFKFTLMFKLSLTLGPIVPFTGYVLGKQIHNYGLYVCFLKIKCFLFDFWHKKEAQYRFCWDFLPGRLKRWPSRREFRT